MDSVIAHNVTSPDRTFADLAARTGRTNAPMLIGVVDTAIDCSHPALVSKRAAGGYDYVDKDQDPSPDAGDAIHGTHVCGIATAGSDRFAVLDLPRGRAGSDQPRREDHGTRVAVVTR